MCFLSFLLSLVSRAPSMSPSSSPPPHQLTDRLVISPSDQHSVDELLDNEIDEQSTQTKGRNGEEKDVPEQVEYWKDRYKKLR